MLFRSAIANWMMSEPELIWSLRQGTTEIAGDTNDSLNNADAMPPESISVHTHTLSEEEAGNISDYDDLQIWFKRSGGEMGEGIKITQAWFEVGGVSEEAATTSPAFLLFME